jgi:hypothetical protein
MAESFLNWREILTVPLDPIALQLAGRHLEAGIGGLEEAAAKGRYNTICIRELACVATLLGQQMVVERATRLLREAPDEVFWAGVITNIELPNVVPETLRQIDSPSELEDHYPRYRRDNILEQIQSFAKTDEHIALCLDNRPHEACEKAASGRMLEEVGVTLAVLGEFDAAMIVARNSVLDDSRKNRVLFVLALELFRSGRIEEFQAISTELGSEDFNAWWRIHLALGIAGREPWGDYPYPDW